MHNIYLKKLVKIYNAKKVVNSVDITIKSGKVTGLLGPNGAGKTTTFYMVIGIIKPDSGSIFYDKEDITQYPMYLRAKKGVSYLPQEPSVFKKLSVIENIMIILETLNLKREDRKERAFALLEELGIKNLADRKAGVLSGGERRRLEISRSLAINPSFILLDEPFAGIDPLAVDDIKDIIDNILVINPLVVVLTGGEPLLSPYLNIIIESLAGRVGLIIDTNGYVFSQEQLKIFKDKQIVVRISIDSQRPKVNDRYRPVIGDKKKQNLGAKKAIDLLNNCLDKDIASIVHTVTHRYNINDLSGMGEKFVCLGVKVWRILRLSPANDKPNINKVLGYDEDKYFHFYQEIIKKALNDWDKKMQVIIQENLYRERNSVILVSPSGNFMTESPLRGSGKIIIDPNNPKKPQKNELASKINWWAHYNRYLNFE